MSLGVAEGGLILVVVVVVALLIVGLLGVGMIGAGLVMFLRNRGEAEPGPPPGARAAADVARGSAPRSGPLPASPGKPSGAKSSGPKDKASGPKEKSSGSKEKSSGPQEKSSGPKEKSSGPKEKSSGPKEKSSGPEGKSELDDEDTVAPPPPPAYAPPPRSDPPAAFANPATAQATKDKGPSPFAAEFLRIFDDDELEEHAATEVLVRKPGAMLFEASDPHGAPVPGTADASLPGKVVASKKP